MLELVHSRLLLFLFCFFSFAFSQTLSYIVQAGDTLSQIGRSYGVAVSDLLALNELNDADRISIGQTLEIPVTIWAETQAAPFDSFELFPQTAIQGRVQALKFRLGPGVKVLEASYLGERLELFSPQPHNYHGLLVTPVLQESEAVLSLRLLVNETERILALPLTIKDGAYQKEEIWLSEETSQLLIPEVVTAEHKLIDESCAVYEALQRWQGVFRSPLGEEAGVRTSPFGVLRSYNGGPYGSFHRGLDFRANATTPIYAAADGVVVLSERLQVRGNTVLISHGLGVCSGYMHLNERRVLAGQTVRVGELLGYAGETGLVTGPHLHWELRVHSVPVEPLQWLEQEIDLN